MKDIKKISLLLVLPLIFSCGENPTTSGLTTQPTVIESITTTSVATTVTTEETTVVSPYKFNLVPTEKEVDFHSDLQIEYLNDPEIKSVGHYVQGLEELSKPKGVELSFTVEGLPENFDGPYTFQVSEDKDFKTFRSYDTDDGKMTFNNMKLATTYYWRGAVSFPDITFTSEPLSFVTTEYGPRNLDVEGVKNVRDIGGYFSGDDKIVKQGMFYRTGRLNQSSSSSTIIEITDKGKEVMLRDLGIKSDIDLRLASNNEIGSITESPLGSSVNYFNTAMDYNTTNMLTKNKEQIVVIFDNLLSNEDNYPFICHCNIGTDRTGLVAYLLLGLLGADIDDIDRDYLFSNFSDIGKIRNVAGTDVMAYRGLINRTSGETLAEKTYNYLSAIGVKTSSLDAIRNIMLEDC